MAELSASRIGAAGAFYAAAQLAQRGWDASITFGNTPHTDIVAQHADLRRLIAVQCKTRAGDRDFVLGFDCETPSPPGRDEWFILIALKDARERPDFYVVARDVMAAYLYVSHRTWLRGAKPDGSPRRENRVRKFELAATAPFRERWELLEAPAAQAPYWLPQLVFDAASRVGLPDGHPGLIAPSDGFTSTFSPRWAARRSGVWGGTWGSSVLARTVTRIRCASAGSDPAAGWSAYLHRMSRPQGGVG